MRQRRTRKRLHLRHEHMSRCSLSDACPLDYKCAHTSGAEYRDRRTRRHLSRIQRRSDAGRRPASEERGTVERYIVGYPFTTLSCSSIFWPNTAKSANCCIATRFAAVIPAANAGLFMRDRDAFALALSSVSDFNHLLGGKWLELQTRWTARAMKWGGNLPWLPQLLPFGTPRERRWAVLK